MSLMHVTKNRLTNPALRVATSNLPATSFPDNTPVETLQSWFLEMSKDGGTAAGLNASQASLPLTQSSIPGEPSTYLTLAFSSAGTSLGNNSYIKLYTRLAPDALNGFYAIFSFWMSSDATRPIGVLMRRNYGTGGSPSPDDIFPLLCPLSCPVFTANLGWQRYSVSGPILPMNLVAMPRTFGTNNDGYVEIAIYFQAGSTLGMPFGALVPPVGTNTILIAQPQLEAGTVATAWEEPNPIQKGVLQTDLDGGNRSITNLLGLTVGGYPVLRKIVLSQTLASGVDLATFDLTSLGLSTAPTMIIPILVKSGSTRLNIKPTGRTWTNTSYTCDLDGRTDDVDYVVEIIVIP